MNDPRLSPIERLSIMAEDEGETYDLSLKDRAAILWAVSKVKELEALVETKNYLMGLAEKQHYMDVGKVEAAESRLAAAEAENAGLRSKLAVAENGR